MATTCPQWRGVWGWEPRRVGAVGYGKGSREMREVGVLKGWEAGEIARKYAIEKEAKKKWVVAENSRYERQEDSVKPLVNTQQKKKGLENRKVRGGGARKQK